jgi:hypothetical protein
MAGAPQLKTCGECAVRTALEIGRSCGTGGSLQRAQQEGVKKDLLRTWT